MEKLTSILVVIDPVDETRHVIAKAMVLARHFGARLELFLCDSEQAFIRRHAYDPDGVEKALRECTARGERFLDAMRRSLADDVEIATHVASSSPLYEAVLRRVVEAQPDLVIKGAAGRHPLQRWTLDANDWQLARTCPAPLMLTRGRPWAARPSFAAAIDVSEHEGTELARAITHTAGFLAHGCSGHLDVVFSDRGGETTGFQPPRAERLSAVVREFRVGEERLRLLHGEPEETLPAFAARQDYDVVVMGALTRQRGLSALVGTLTSKLVDSLECDFVLVKPGSYACPVAAPRRSATV